MTKEEEKRGKSETLNYLKTLTRRLSFDEHN